MTSKYDLQLVTEEQKAQVRKQLGTSEDDIRQAVTCLRHWLQAQPHLPHAMDDGRLERMYINSKCRTEKVKKMLDAYYTLRPKFPDILMNHDPLGSDLKRLRMFVTMTTMPQLTPDLHRVAVLTNVSSKIADFEYTVGLKLCFMVLDYALSCDYTSGYVMLIDLKNTTAGHLSKFTVRDLRSSEMICRRAYSNRIVSIHFVNASKIIDIVLSIVKAVLPWKIRNKVMVHLPGSRTLFDYVPERVVPNEMGGTGGAATEIEDALYARLIEKREWLLEQDKFVVNESKRPQDQANDYELFGMDGSFKKLQLD